MLISDKSKKIIDSCRFCWMCRHICPIGNATGQERNTSRARALALSYVERGAASLSDCIDNVYECALCGACTKECATGWDPVVFTKEVRREAALEGLTPAYIASLVEAYGKTGNVFGKTEYCDCLAKEIEALPASADTLLYLGAEARYLAPVFAKNAILALKKAGVTFTVLKDEPESGYELDALVGATEETKEAMQKCAAALNGYKTVLVLDPQDAKTFLREYKEWNVELSCEIKTFTSVLADLVKNGKLNVAATGKTYTYQDHPYLGRDLAETEEGRAVVEKAGKLSEMLLGRKDTMFAGNLLMNEWMPDVMRLVAKKRLENIAETGADAVVVTSPSEYVLLSDNAPENLAVVALQELCLG